MPSNPIKPFFTAFLLLGGGLASHAQTTADVIVYGSTPGGYCAAIGAAREGASVILLEPTQHVVHSGPSSIHSGRSVKCGVGGGVYEERTWKAEASVMHLP